VDLFARKVRRLQPGSNPRSWVPEASLLTTRPPKPYATMRNTLSHPTLVTTEHSVSGLSSFPNSQQTFLFVVVSGGGGGGEWVAKLLDRT
jgi:hypothetical protein